MLLAVDVIVGLAGVAARLADAQEVEGPLAPGDTAPDGGPLVVAVRAFLHCVAGLGLRGSGMCVHGRFGEGQPLRPCVGVKV